MDRWGWLDRPDLVMETQDRRGDSWEAGILDPAHTRHPKECPGAWEGSPKLFIVSHTQAFEVIVFGNSERWAHRVVLPKVIGHLHLPAVAPQADFRAQRFK